MSEQATDLPVCERITRNVIETLQNVSVQNGYTVDLSVQRARPQGNPPAHLLAVVCEGDDEEQGDDEADIGSAAWIRPYEVVVYVFASALASEDLYGQIINCIRSDIHKALRVDVTRGGWALNTMIRGAMEFSTATDAAGILVMFDVLYRHDLDNPYQRTQTGAP